MDLLGVLTRYTGDTLPFGFCYSSRKHKDHFALAIESGKLCGMARPCERQRGDAYWRWQGVSTLTGHAWIAMFAQYMENIG
jgi:hypothetical protein